MKALIKGGLCLALSWLANAAPAQEIQWKAATAKPAAGGSVRPVSVGQPLPLGAGSDAFRSSSPSFSPIVRAQAGDDKAPLPVPKLDVEAGDQKVPRPMPKDGKFTPPPPQTAPGPVFGSLGMTPDNGCFPDCGPASCGLDAGCCPPRSRWWVGAEYLMWWQRAQSVPPLVTANPPGTPGFLNDPSTTVLYNDVPNQMRSGGRFTMGRWMPHFCNLGIDTTFFFLNRDVSTSTFTSTGNPQLVRPFYDAEANNLVDGEIASPGSVTIRTYSQLWGIDANLRRNWLCGPGYWLDCLVGYRYLNLGEGIDITENRFVGAVGGPRLQIIEQESFHTRTQFNGVQFGLAGECRFWNRWYLGMTTKLAMGSVHQVINIDGSTTFVAPAPIGTVVQPGALLAGPTNTGVYTKDRFAVLPEIGFKLGVDVTDRLRLYVGYDFLYLSSVVRPGDQIDLAVSPSYRPLITGPGPGGGPPRPTVPFQTSSYWAQGMNFGMLYRY